MSLVPGDLFGKGRESDSRAPLFREKSAKTSKSDLAVARSRLKRVLARLRGEDEN
jgi:hypothetical protein